MTGYGSSYCGLEVHDSSLNGLFMTVASMAYHQPITHFPLTTKVAGSISTAQMQA